MKVLSVQQPWASLIVAGIKTVENRTWQPKQLPGRILIHASKKTSLRLMNHEPLEWVQEIFNEQLFGNLPNFTDMPANAIIGYVTVERIDKDNANSVWAAGESNDERLYYWHLTDAHVFDEPIVGVKGKLHLWDYDLDAGNLPPAHNVSLARLSVDGDNVNVPLTAAHLATLQPNQSLTIELGTVADVMCQPDVYALKPLKTVTFFHGSQRRTFALSPETDAQYYVDDSEEENPAMFFSKLHKDGAVRWVANLVWGDEQH